MPGHKQHHRGRHSTPITQALTLRSDAPSSSHSHHRHNTHHNSFLRDLAENVAGRVIANALSPQPAPLVQYFAPAPAPLLSFSEQQARQQSLTSNWDYRREGFLKKAHELLEFSKVVLGEDTSFSSDVDLKSKLAEIEICIRFYNDHKYMPSIDDQEIFKKINELEKQVKTKIKAIEDQQMLPIDQAVANIAEADITAKLEAAKQFLIQGQLSSARSLIIEVNNIVSNYKLHVNLFENPELANEFKKHLYRDAIATLGQYIYDDEQRYFRLANKILKDALSLIKKSDETLLARHRQTLIQAMGQALVKNQHKFYMQDQKNLTAAMTTLISQDLNEVSATKKLARSLQVLGSWDTLDLKHSKALPHMLAWMIETQPLTTIPTFTIALFPKMQIPCLDITAYPTQSEIDYDWNSKISDLQQALERWDPLLRLDKSQDSQEIKNEKQTLLQWQYRRVATATAATQLYQAHVVEPPPSSSVLDALLVDGEEAEQKPTSPKKTLEFY